MIEILVSMTIVAFGLLGLAGLQARSMSFQKDSFDRKAAAEQIEQIAERIRANFDGFIADEYTRTMLPGDATPTIIPACAVVTDCQPDEAADRDWAMWQIDLRRQLPVSGAYLRTVLGGTGPVAVQVTIAWQEGNTRDGQLVPQPDPICNVAPVNIADPTYRCFSWAIRP